MQLTRYSSVILQNCLKCNNDGNRQDSRLAYAPCDCDWSAKTLDMHRSYRTVDRILLVGQSLHVVANDGPCLQLVHLKKTLLDVLLIHN